MSDLYNGVSEELIVSDAIIVAGAGICCLDHIVTSPAVKWGDTAMVSDYQAQGGGLDATAMVACARLGASCRFYSLLGDDTVGDQIAAGMLEENVSTDGIVRVNGGCSPFSFIHVDEKTGERTIFHRPGSGLDRGIERLDLSGLLTAQALLVDDVYPSLSISAAKAARANSIPVVADMASGQANAEVLRHVDLLVAPKHFASERGLQDDLPKALDKIHELGPTTAVITLGSEGCIFSDKSGIGRCKPFAVDVVDTTGAGDAFHGAFTYGVARGWDTARCAEFASAVAAIKCTKPGGRSGLPSLPHTIEFLKQNGEMQW